eukprot:10757900-Ditylum_brightwellii.AAC.1
MGVLRLEKYSRLHLASLGVGTALAIVAFLLPPSLRWWKGSSAGLQQTQIILFPVPATLSRISFGSKYLKP